MINDKRLIPVFVVVFVDLLGFSIILPLLPYYARDLGASPVMIGLLLSSYSVCQFIASPILGDLSDRYGRRPVLIYSQIGSCLGFILMALATHLPVPLVWLMAARMIDGLSGGNLTVAQACVSDISRPEERAKNFGMIIGVSFGLGFMIGPLLGGFLSRFGYGAPAWLAATFSLASMLGTIFLLPEPNTNRAKGTRRAWEGIIGNYVRVLEYLRLPEMRRVLLVFFFMSAPFTLYVTMYAIFTDRRLGLTAEEAGYFLGFAGLMGIIWQGALIGPLVKRIGDYRALVIGLSCSTIGLFSLVLVDVWWKLIFVAVVFSFGHGISRPSLTSILTATAHPQRRGGALGATSSLESLTRIIMPMIGSSMVAQSPGMLGWVGGVLFAISVILALGLRQPAEPAHGSAA